MWQLILYALRPILEQLGVIVAKLDELNAILVRVDAATNNIADDIRRLSQQITPGLTDAEVAELQASLEAAAVKLEGVAAVTPEPSST